MSPFFILAILAIVCLGSDLLFLDGLIDEIAGAYESTSFLPSFSIILSTFSHLVVASLSLKTSDIFCSLFVFVLKVGFIMWSRSLLA